jgi:hypothetical protein
VATLRPEAIFGIVLISDLTTNLQVFNLPVFDTFALLHSTRLPSSSGSLSTTLKHQLTIVKMAPSDRRKILKTYMTKAGRARVRKRKCYHDTCYTGGVCRRPSDA